jgi:hypothetical protein
MNQKERSELVARIGKEWTDKGKLIEGGFQAMRIIAMDPDAPPDQVREMRMAFFGGAQHLFGTIMSILDPGNEPTDADMRRMDLIDKELKEFITVFAKQHLKTEGNA